MYCALAFKQLPFVDLLEAPEGVRGGGYLKRTRNAVHPTAIFCR